MIHLINWENIFKELSEPFPKEDVFWRPGRRSNDGKRAQALPYAESRSYEDRLNTICYGEWSLKFTPWGENRIICELTIHGVTRSSTGEFDTEKRNAVAEGTVAEAQAFKRACSKFGLGRYMYDVPIQWVDYDEDRKSLKNNPEIPAEFLPKPVMVVKPAMIEKPAVEKPAVEKSIIEKPMAEKAVNNEKAPESQSLDFSAEILSPERAKAMANELEKLGYPKREQLRMAASVLEKPVRDLTQLSDGEAFEVWSYAKRVSRQAA
jgi:Rad52/22 family double-strand break repair protein